MGRIFRGRLARLPPVCPLDREASLPRVLPDSCISKASLNCERGSTRSIVAWGSLRPKAGSYPRDAHRVALDREVETLRSGLVESVRRLVAP